MNNAIDVLILDIQGISGGYSLFPLLIDQPTTYLNLHNSTKN